MEPKKKTITDFLIPILGFIFILIISLQIAISYDNVKNLSINHDYTNTSGELIKKRTFNYPAFFNDLDKRTRKNFFDITWVDSSPRFILYGLIFYFFICLYLATTRKKFITNKEYGTAEWENIKAIEHLLAANLIDDAIKEVKKEAKQEKFSDAVIAENINNVKLKFSDCNNILFTQTEKICMYNYELNNNTLIIGGPSASKSRGYVFPNILQCSDNPYSPSLVITDPKGEALKKTGKYLVSQGYVLKILDLKEQRLSFGYNPFKYVLEEKYEEDISILVSNVMESTNENKHSNAKDPFWENMAKVLLNAIFFATYIGFPMEERNMPTVMELFRWFEVSDDDDRTSNPTRLDLFFEVFAQDEAIRQKYGDVNTNPALRNWEDFRTKCKGKTAQSVTATALAKLAPFDEKEIRRIFSKDELELDLIGERKTALFIVLNPTSKIYNFIGRMVYSQLFRQIEYCATVKHEERLPVPIRIIMEEAYNTGRFPDFENFLSYARSYGVGISIILQSLEQLKEMYEKSWGTIIDCCSTFLFLGGIKHPDTLEYVSKLIGKGTFDKRSYNRTRGRQSSSGTSDDKIGRELQDYSELQRLKKNKCILIISGYNPFYSTKFQYKKHVNYKFTSDYSKKNMYIRHDELEQKFNSSVTHGEKIINEKPSSIKQFYRTAPISLNVNEDEAIDYLMENVLSLDLESGEEVALSFNELEEFKMINNILEEEKENNIKISSLVEKIITAPIEISSDIESLNTVIQDMSSKLSEIDLVSPSDMGEISSTNDEEIWEDDSFISLNNIDKQLTILSDDMVNNGFLEDLNNIDINILDNEESV